MNNLYYLISQTYSPAHAAIVETTLGNRHHILRQQLAIAKADPDKYPPILVEMYQNEISHIEEMLPGKEIVHIETELKHMMKVNEILVNKNRRLKDNLNKSTNKLKQLK